MFWFTHSSKNTHHSEGWAKVKTRSYEGSSGLPQESTLARSWNQELEPRIKPGACFLCNSENMIENETAIVVFQVKP